MVPLETIKQFFSFGSYKIALVIGGIVVLTELVKLYMDFLLGVIHTSKKSAVERYHIKSYLFILAGLISLQGAFSLA